MNFFKKLIGQLYDDDIVNDISQIKNSVRSRINNFAQRYLSPESYRRYLNDVKNVVYEISFLPSRIEFYYNRARNSLQKFVSGILGYYDLLRNKIVLNSYLSKDQLEHVLAHESVHLATRNWALEYFKRFGEAARPIIEGFTELITRGLGYYSRVYDEYVKAAENTLKKLGRDTSQTLYDIINFRKSPESVLLNFYGSMQCCYR
ncbi:MAG: hypothetical protein KQA41_02625 [Candidatus Aenigmarchaeota archaeon]|nr:hypothetical protein [Candidatus Aenigmarchaeota archaeon]MBU5689095.1 hypothetical protein [Candidatus Aenigmarchaeota archaeon]